MGCCASTLSPRSIYSNNQPNSSSRAITGSQPPSQAALPRPSTHASNYSSHQNGHASQPLSTHINRRLRRHVRQSNSHTWTQVALDRERIEFFDTRVTGRPEIWQTIRAALEVLYSEDASQDAEGSLATAQQILDAAGVTVPTGDMVGGVYDTFGAFYPLPEHIVANPVDLMEMSQRGMDDNINKGENTVGDQAVSEVLVGDGALLRREEKGKGVLNVHDPIMVKARLSDNGGPDIVVQTGKSDSVRVVTRRVFEASGLTAPKSIRIAYLGKVLNVNQTLTVQGWKEGHVVNALVFG